MLHQVFVITRVKTILLPALFLIIFSPGIAASEITSENNIIIAQAQLFESQNQFLFNEQDNFFRRLFGLKKRTKAERSSRSQRHSSSRPERYSPPESNSRDPESYSGRRAESGSDMGSTTNTPKAPLHTSFRDKYHNRGQWELGFSFGSAHAITDIAGNKNMSLSSSASYHTQNFDLNFGFFARHIMNSWFAINLGAEYVSLSAQNLDLIQNPDIPAVRFENDIFEFYGKTEFMLPALERSPLDIYGFIGIGIFFSDARIFQENDMLVQITDNYSQVQPVIPLGFGVSFKPIERLKIGYEFGWRNTIFHYLDGVNVANEKYDSYFLNSFKISYSF